MNKKDSNPIYPPDKHKYFSDFRSASMMVDSPWEEIDEANERAHLTHDYDMEAGEDMYFEDINDYGNIEVDDVIEDLDFNHFGYLTEDEKKH